MFDRISAYLSRKNVSLVFQICLGLLAFFSVFIIYERSTHNVLLGEEYIPVTIVGEYSKDGGETYIPFNSYDEIDFSNTSRMLIRGNIDRTLTYNDKLYMFFNYISASVYINGKIVYASDNNNSYCWDSLGRSFIRSTDTVEFDLVSPRKLHYSQGMKQFLQNLNTGTKNAILVKMTKKHFLGIIGQVILLVLGMIMLFYRFIVSKTVQKNTYGLFSCGIAMITAALTCFVNPEYITLLFSRFEVLEYIDTMFQCFTVFFVFVYFQRYIKEEDLAKRAKWLVYLAYAALTVFLIIKSLGDKTNKMPIVFLFVVGIFICIYYIFLFAKSISRRNDSRSKVVSYSSLVLLICTFFEMAYYIMSGTFMVSALEIGMIVFGLSQMLVVSSELTKAAQDAEKSSQLEHELMQSQIKIMMSQIQPHFLYNALGTIRALCTKDPETARSALDFFAKYLRSNLAALDKVECIPFTKEMEHVESYLYIEKLRFGDRLNVEYDVQVSDFMIPCMSVQTLTENAVKHGLLKKQEGGTVSIRTKETPGYYEIQIVDDGVGIDYNRKLDESRTHVGIENTRMRIAGMCGGTLAIGSKLGQGTTVTICIPKGDRESDENYFR